MKLKFKIQQYQTDAVESVINVFKGQPNQANLEYRMDKGKLYVVDSKKHDIKFVQTNVFADSDDAGNSLSYKNNRLVMDKVALFDNIRQIQTENNIHQDEELCQKLGACQLDVEMETGTGKTYVYIKTMFELNKQYGWTKFIVVVPSIAIREGVKKSFDITVDHFMEQYGKKARYFIYDSSSLNDIDTFSQSNDISVMIINTQAFNTMKEGAKNKAARIINSERDEFGPGSLSPFLQPTTLSSSWMNRPRHSTRLPRRKSMRALTRLHRIRPPSTSATGFLPVDSAMRFWCLTAAKSSSRATTTA